MRRLLLIGAILAPACGDNDTAVDAAVVIDSPPVLPHWAAPEPAERAEPGNFQTLRLQVDGSGRVVIVWDEITSGALWANRYVPGTGWGQADRIDTEGSAAAADLAMNARGDAVVVWEQRGGGGDRQDIWARTLSAAGGKGDAVALEGGTLPARSPRVVIDAAGNATAAWEEGPAAGDVAIQVARLAPGGNWSAGEPLDTTKAPASLRRLIGEPGGASLVIWSRLETPAKPTIKARFHDGKAWGGPKVFAGQDGTQEAHQAILVSPTRALVVWTRPKPDTLDLFGASLDADTGWGDPGAPLASYASLVRVQPRDFALDGHGNVLTTWHVSPDLPDEHVDLRRWSPAAGWDPVMYLTPPQLYEVGHGMAVNAAGDGVIAWRQRALVGSPTNPDFTYAVAARRLVAGTWQDPLTIAEPTDPADLYAPRVAIDAQGNTVAVWIQCDAPKRCDVLWSRFVPGSPAAP